MDDSIYQSPTLPLELFRPILEELHLQSDLTTLSSAALACQTLRYESQGWLFRSPMGLGPAAAGRVGRVLRDGGAKYFKRVKDGRMHVEFLMTIASCSLKDTSNLLWGPRRSKYANPHLARYVKSYSLDSIVEYQENPLWSLLLTTLPMMSNLKSLTFRAFGGHPAAKELLANCTFQLNYLDWGCHSDEAGISTFLLGQQELRHISLNCDSLLNRTLRQPSTSISIYSGATPEPVCLQKLASIEGSRAVIESLLPTRSVTSLSWVPQMEDDISEPVDHLNEELGKLKSLSFGGYFARPHLRLVAPYLKSVEVLELVGLHDLDVSLYASFLLLPQPQIAYYRIAVPGVDPRYLASCLA